MKYKEALEFLFVMDKKRKDAIKEMDARPYSYIPFHLIGLSKEYLDVYRAEIESALKIAMDTQ